MPNEKCDGEMVTSDEEKRAIRNNDHPKNPYRYNVAYTSPPPFLQNKRLYICMSLTFPLFCTTI
jgi:hypothetical protein